MSKPPRLISGTPVGRCVHVPLYPRLHTGPGTPSGKEPNQQQENDGANKGRYQTDEVETSESPTKAQCAQDEPADEGANDAHDDISEDAEPSASNNEACQPSGDPADDDPDDNRA
jgi:hypothetical protein